MSVSLGQKFFNHERLSQITVVYDNARFAIMVEISADEGSEIRESSRNNICSVQCDVLDTFFYRFKNSEEQRTDAIYSIPFNGAHMPNNSKITTTNRRYHLTPTYSSSERRVASY